MPRPRRNSARSGSLARTSSNYQVAGYTPNPRFDHGPTRRAEAMTDDQFHLPGLGLESSLEAAMTTMIKRADISPCTRYRWTLSRVWGDGPQLCWVMLNP